MRVDVVAVVLCLSLVPNAAQANCVGPSQNILWSYPADGDTEIPTNANLWIANELGQTNEVTLEGEVLTALVPGFGFELGELAPLTTYTVALPSLGFPGEANLTITFTTGEGPEPTATLDAPDVLQLTREQPVLIAPNTICRSILNRQGCFDTGEPLRARYETDSQPLAWLVERSTCENTTYLELWPASCGAPLLPLTFTSACARLSAITNDTMSTPSEYACIRPDLPPGVTLPTTNTCTQDLYALEPPLAAPTVNAPGEKTALNCALSRVAPLRANAANYSLGVLALALLRYRRRRVSAPSASSKAKLLP